MLKAVGRAGIAALLGAVWVFALDRVGAVLLSTPTALGGRPGALLFSGFLTIQLALAVVFLLLLAVGGRLRDRRVWVGLLFAVLAAAPGWYAADAITAGEWVAEQSWAGAAKVGVIAAVVIGAALLGVLHTWFRERLVWPFALLAWAVGLAVADAVVLPGLYPELHLCLEVGSAVFTALAMHRITRLLLGRPWGIGTRVGAVLAGLATLASPAIAYQLRDQTSALLLSSPVAANTVPLVLLGGQTDMLRVVLSQLDLRPAARPSIEAQIRAAHPDWNVILVVVDTLRADALPPGRANSEVFPETDLTPNLDRLISKSYRFPFAYAQASRTMFSMPAMMRSLEGVGTDPTEGVALSHAMAARGRTPVAVLPQYFLDPEDPPVRALLEGYEDVAFYEKNAQQDLVPKVREMLAAQKGRPFFAWIHFFNMHQPGYAYDRILTKTRDGSLQKRYKASLKWLDGEWGKLWRVFEDLELTQNTVIIFASDHGEHVGEKKREGHGGHVLEPEMRVPWVIYIPGTEGGVREQTVGNIDIAPTLLDAIGAAPVQSHLGHSVLPILDNPDAHWPWAYSMRNSRGTILALSLNRQKMFVYKGGSILHRFNIDQDPQESENLFSLSDPVDREVLLELLVRRPDLAAREIVGEAGATNRGMLLSLLESVDAKTASGLGQRLRLLIGLVALAPEPELLVEADRLFRDGDDKVRLVIADQMGRHQTWTTERLVARLKAVENTPVEHAFVLGLAAQGQRGFAGVMVGRAIQSAAKSGDLPRLDAWLEMTRSWRIGARNFGAPMRASLVALADGTSEQRIRLLDNLKNLNFGSDLVTSEFARERAEAWLAHPDPAVGTGAAKVLGRLGPVAKASAPALIATLQRHDAELRLRQAAMGALASVARKEAVSHVIEAGKDPLLTYEAIQIMGRLGGDAKAAIPWLQQIRKSHWRRWIRGQAAKTIKAVASGVPSKG